MTEPHASDRPEDRRRFGRIHLTPPISAKLAEARVDIVDLALSGARVMSQARFAPGLVAELKFESEQGAVDASCRVVRCTLAQFASKPGEKSVYQSGLQIVETIGDSDRIIREIIAAHVFQALEEQRANALGLPPVGPLIEPDDKSDRFRRCELIDGTWRRSESKLSDQPAEGFTISAAVPIRYVNLLCETYQRADAEGRRLTKILAQLSITKGEGVPMRRYVP